MHTDSHMFTKEVYQKSEVSTEIYNFPEPSNLTNMPIVDKKLQSQRLEGEKKLVIELYLTDFHTTMLPYNAMLGKIL